MRTNIFNIQKFSLHDGPGIRTTVFFKGCPLKCRWCHNPESQCFEPEAMFEGMQYSVRELVKILKKDQIFYDQSGGGVTLSGGEVMAQDMNYIVELMKALGREGISIVIDTSGYAKTENFEKVMAYTDLFLYDLKMIEEELHDEYTGVSNKRILENLKYLSDHGAKIELRMIMVKGVNMDEGQIEAAADWLIKEQIKLIGITLLPYHDFGRDKYGKLGRECTQNFEKPSGEELDRVKEILENRGFAVRVNH